MCCYFSRDLKIKHTYINTNALRSIISQDHLQMPITKIPPILVNWFPRRDKLWSYGVFTCECFTSTLFVDTGVSPGVSCFRFGLMSLRWSTQYTIASKLRFGDSVERKYLSYTSQSTFLPHGFVLFSCK